MRAVQRACATADWYIASVEAVDAQWGPGFRSERPVRLGPTIEASALVEHTHQFVWAFLAATRGPEEVLEVPDGVLFADDLPDKGLGNALVYVRAFDSSYVEVSSLDDRVLRSIEETFAVAPLR